MDEYDTPNHYLLICDIYSDQQSLLHPQASLFNQKLPANNTGFLLQLQAFCFNQRLSASPTGFLL